jgi:hypothetical protein
MVVRALESDAAEFDGPAADRALGGLGGEEVKQRGECSGVRGVGDSEVVARGWVLAQLGRGVVEKGGLGTMTASEPGCGGFHG